MQLLGDLTDNFDSIRIPVKQADRRHGPYPYYGASGIVDHIDGWLFNGEYLLIAEDGENLRTRNTPIAFLAKGKFWVNNHVHIVRGNRNANTRYLLYALSELDISGYLTGSTMPKLTQENLNQISLHAPLLREQQAIAHILGTLDNKIELNRQMNQTLERMARTLFKSWFVDFDPVRAKMDGIWRRGESLLGLPAYLYEMFPDSMVDLELGEIPEGWDLKPLDEIADFRNGLALQNHRPVNNEPRLPVVKIAQLRKGRVDGKEWAKGSITPECIIDDGDVIFSWSGSLLVKVWCGGRAALNQHLFKVTSIEYPKWFFLSWVEQHLKKFQGIATDKATTMGHIRRHHLREVECIIPDKSFLNVVNNMFENLFTKQVLNNIQSRSLVNLRDALLPKLISGKLRVPLTTRRGRK